MFQREYILVCHHHLYIYENIYEFVTKDDRLF